MPDVRTIEDTKPFFKVAKSEVFTMAISADGSKLLVGGGGRKVTRNPAPKPGEPTFTGVTIDSAIRVWDLRSKKDPLCLSGHDWSVTGAAFAKNGSIVSVDCGCDDYGQAIGSLRSWARDGKGQFIVPDAKSRRVAVFPKCNLIVTASNVSDIPLKAWDLSTGAARYKFGEHKYGMESWAAFPEENLLMTGGRGGVLYLWDVARRELACTYHVTDHVYSVAWHPSGKSFATAILPDGASPRGARDEVSVWDLASGRQLAKFQERPSYKVGSVAFTPDGRYLAGGGTTRKSSKEDCVVHFWDLQTGEEVLNLKGHTQSVHSFAFTPNGKTLFTAARDKTVRRWSLPKLTARKSGQRQNATTAADRQKG